MLRTLLAFALLTASLEGAVKLTRSDGRIEVEIDGQPFSAFYYGADAPKPYLHPLRSASGKIVTRRFPMEKVPGETTTDQHHRPLWIGYKQINGFDFWENEFSYHNAKAGKVVTRGIDEVKDGTITATFEWLSPSGEAMLRERRTMVFSGGSTVRVIDISAAFEALTPTTFGDSKDGAFAIRLSDQLSEKKSGTIANSNGGRTMKETWGKPANWVDYSGELEGEKLGVAVFEHASSFHHPARWHVRDYGLLAANPFGSSAFDKQAPDSTFTLGRGGTLRLRYRVVIHGAKDAAAIDELYGRYAREP